MENLTTALAHTPDYGSTRLLVSHEQSPHDALKVVVGLREADALVGLRQLRPSRTEHIVLDPPRSGAGRQLVEAIAQRKPAGIVYLSCDPTTLARDLAGLRRAGYAIRDVRLFDMFPDTFHLETLVRLEPA